MKNLIAYCGLDCEKCETYIATKNNDIKLKERVARDWSKLNGITISPDMINCDGCRANGRKTIFCDSLCEIRKCARKNKYSTCGSCKNVDKCDKSAMITSEGATTSRFHININE